MATPSAAWKALTEDKDPTNWAIMHFDAGKNLIVHKTGSGGLLDMNSHITEEKEVVVAAIKVTGVDQQQNVTSRRPKYVLITIIPRAVSPLRKGLILQKKGEIDNLFKGITCLLQFSDCAAPPKDLTHLGIGKSLLAAGGAHKPVFYDFGGGEHLSLKDIYDKKDWDKSFPSLDAGHGQLNAHEHANAASPVAAAPASPQPASPQPAAPASPQPAAAPASPQADAAPAPAPAAEAAPAPAADAPKPE